MIFKKQYLDLKKELENKGLDLNSSKEIAWLRISFILSLILAIPIAFYLAHFYFGSKYDITESSFTAYDIFVPFYCLFYFSSLYLFYFA